MMRHNSALQRDSFGRKLRKTRHSVVVAGLAIVWLGCTPLVSQADAITYTRSGVSINETFGHLPGLGDGNVDPLSSFTFARYVVVDEPPGRVSLAAEATAYATVVQRAAGSSELPFRLHFRAQAFARPFLGYTVNSSASALIEVQDTLKFQPQSGVPASSLAAVSGFGVVIHLDGFVAVNDIGVASVGVIGELGGGAASFIDTIDIIGGFDLHQIDQTIFFTSAPSINPFDPDGLGFRLIVSADVTAYVSGHADAIFGNTVSVLGIVALDSDGNVIPGIGNLVGISSDSGARYPFLDSIPTSRPVPELSSLVSLSIAMLIILFFHGFASVSPKRRGQPG